MGQIRNAVAKAQVMNAPVPQAAPAFGQPAPGLFGNTSAPAFGFGATSPPAPSTGLFGSSTAPAAPTPAFGFGIFGYTWCFNENISRSNSFFPMLFFTLFKTASTH